MDPNKVGACIVVRGLWYQYAGDIVALRGIDLAIPHGAVIAVIGQNGSGKSTLAKHFNGLLKPTRGQVLVKGQDTRDCAIGQLARSVGFVFQNPDHQLFASSTHEEIAFGLRNLGLSSEEVARRAKEELERFGLVRYAEAPPALLGFGLRRKITIAAVVAMRPEILILDEPTIGLDWGSTRELIDLVLDFRRAGHTVLLVTHDMKVAAAFSDLTLVLHDGQVLLFGETRDVFRQTETLRASHIRPPQITELANSLRGAGMPEGVLTVGEFFEAYRQLR